jgi:regulatory protein
MKSERKYSLLEAKIKIEAWCAYQERCFSEVQSKLIQLGCSNEDVERLVAELIKSNFLNEERFARAFCSGKFNIKGWGKVKIRQHLKQKRVSDKCIEYGMQEIDPDMYFNRLVSLAQRKQNELTKEVNPWVKKAKVIRFLQQKGYENDLIYEAMGQSGYDN